MDFGKVLAGAREVRTNGATSVSQAVTLDAIGLLPVEDFTTTNGVSTIGQRQLGQMPVAFRCAPGLRIAGFGGFVRRQDRGNALKLRFAAEPSIQRFGWNMNLLSFHSLNRGEPHFSIGIVQRSIE